MVLFLTHPLRLQPLLSRYVNCFTRKSATLRPRQCTLLCVSSSSFHCTTHPSLLTLSLLPRHARFIAPFTTARPLWASAAPPASTAASARPSTAQSAATAPLPLVYQHDRSSYYRRLTLAATASLGLLWLPLCYVSILVATPPLYSALLGPLAAIATLVATHYRARRIIRTLHRTPAGLLVHTYTTLGQPHRIGVIPYSEVKPVSSGGGSGSKQYWIVSLEGFSRYFLIDRAGEVVDSAVMRRLVGWEEVESEEERVKRQRDGVRGPGTLGRLHKR